MKELVFNIKSEKDFHDISLQIFKHQFENNVVYRSFCDLLYIHPSDVKSIEKIPFLPIEFFKSKKVLSSKSIIQETFTSSGTTGTNVSKHLVSDISWYQESFTKGFENNYGAIKDYTVLALLPNYLERKGLWP